MQILLLLLFCHITVTATPYAHTRMHRTTVFETHTSIYYTRHHLDRSARHTRLSLNSDGIQHISLYDISDTGYIRQSPRPRQQISVYTMMRRPDPVTLQRPVVSVGHTASRQGLFDGWNSGNTTRAHLVTSAINSEPIIAGYGITSPSVRYGRTGNLGDALTLALTAIGSTRPNSLATTTLDNDPTPDVQKFGENPSFDESVPLGDAVLPMLLLMLVLVCKKLSQ